MGDVITCPVCNARVPPGATQCIACRMSFAGVTGASASSVPSPRVTLPTAPPAHAQRGIGRLPLGPLGARETSPPTPPPTFQPAMQSMRAYDDVDELATADDATHRRMSLEAGAVLRERYQLIEPMGEGVLGSSWRARDLSTGAAVVLKVAADMLGPNERDRSDLVGKLEMFAGRTLPGVVMPREVFAVPGNVIIVYPCVDAVSLRMVIDARRATGQRFTPEECLRVALSLTSALQAMHSASAHGALWPQNVLITARGLLLIDGFIAVAVAPDRLAGRIEHHPRSSPFAAPEVINGRRPTASADLYALGAIAAEIAGGAAPGHGPDLASISQDLHRAAATLLDREPSRRPGGVRMLLDALSAAAGYTHRPADPPLTVPESVLVEAGLVADHSVPAALDPATLPVASFVAPRVSAGVVATASPSASMPPAPAIRPAPASASPPSAAAISAPPPSAAAISAPPGPAGPPGRLRGPTATLPASNLRPQGVAASGPPPSMSVKSGPPTGAAPAATARPPERPPPRADQPPVSARPLSVPAAIAAEGPSDPRNVPKTLPSINQAIRAAVKSSRPAPTPAPPRPPPPPMPQGRSVPMPVRPMPPPPARPASSAPPRPPPRPPPSPPSASPKDEPAERSLRDDDAIDPKLLRVARMLDDERRRGP